MGGGFHIEAPTDDKAETWDRWLWDLGEFSERMAWPSHAPAESGF